MRIASVLAVVLVGLAGCGGGGNGDEAVVRQTLKDWLSAMASHEDARACSFLTPGLQKSIDVQLRQRAVRGSCRTYASRWISSQRPPGRRDAVVDSVDLAGAHGSATLRARPDLESDVVLVKVGGRWRIQNY